MRHKIAIMRHKIANMRHRIPNMRHRIANMRHKIANMRHRIANMRHRIANMRHKIGKKRNKIAKKSNRIACFTAGKALILKEHPVNSIQFRSISVSIDFCKIILPEKAIYTRAWNMQHATKKKYYMRVISLALSFRQFLKKPVRFQKLSIHENSS